MKAIRIHERGNVEVMKLEEIECPVPQKDEVLIQVAAAGVNQSDLGQRRGDYPNLVALPMTLGNEVAGIVTELGSDVSTVQKGERVVALVNGGYAEYAVAKAKDVIPLPSGVSFAQATVTPIQGQTAYLLLTKAARFQKGERVLIHAAAGGVGSLAVQLAKLLGAGMIIGTDIQEEKLPFIRELGADAAITTQEDWVVRVMQLTQGQGVDVVLEAIGGEIGQQSLACLAPFGRMVVFGSLAGAITPFVAQQLIRGCQSITGYNTLIQPVAEQRDASQTLLHLIEKGQLRVILEHTVPFSEAAAAHQAIEQKRTRGKVVLIVNPRLS